MKYSFLILFFSVVTFAINLKEGQSVELTNYMNARYSARFTESDKNVVGTLNKGDKGTVREIKKFKSGNSGFLIEVLDGKLKSQKVWVYYDEKSPSLALVDKDQQPTASVDDADTAIAQKKTPVVREPATGPGVTMSDADRAIADLARLNKPGASSDCALCKPGGIESKFAASVSSTMEIKAKISCTYKASPGAIGGAVELEIENNIVKKFNAKIDGCSVSLKDFKPQEAFANKNIMLSTANGCDVIFGQATKVRNTTTPILDFGFAPTEACAAFCPKLERKHWQVEMNPLTQSCY